MWGSNCWWGTGYFFGGPWLVMIGLPLLAAVILGTGYLILTLVRRSASSGTPQGEDALHILKRRYAAGELNAEEFARVKKDLQ